MIDSINQKVKNVLSKHTKMPAQDMTDDLPLENTEIDSLGVMELMFDLEDAFDVEIPEPTSMEERKNQFRTVGDVVELIASLVQNQKAAA